MDYSQSFAISAIGMDIERARVDVAALNLANANTVQSPGSVAYRPMRVVVDTGAFDAMVSSGADMAAQYASPVRVMPTHALSRQVYEPGNPMANERGFVSYSGVDMATEMVSLMSATRAYEANVAAMNTSRTLALRALDIGRGQA